MTAQQSLGYARGEKHWCGGFRVARMRWGGMGGGSKRKEKKGQGHQDTHVDMSVNYPEKHLSWVTTALTKCSCLGSRRSGAGGHTCKFGNRNTPPRWDRVHTMTSHAPPCFIFWQRALPSLCRRASPPTPCGYCLWVQSLTQERRHPKGNLGLASLTPCLEDRTWHWPWGF